MMTTISVSASLFCYTYMYMHMLVTYMYMLVSYPDPPTEEIEKGFGQKVCTSLSPCTKSCRTN